MKELFLIRHAHATESFSAGADFDRALSKRGLDEASQMAQSFVREVDRVSAIVTSPAVRALATARIFASAFPDMPEIVTVKSLYNAPMRSILSVLTALPEAYESVILVGHNPGLSELASALSDEYCALQPCSVVHLRLEAEDWRMMSAGLCHLVSLISPEDVL